MKQYEYVDSYNEVVYALGVENVIKEIQVFCDLDVNKKSVILTIGGGTGEAEYNAKRNILNIDPNPLSFCPPSLRNRHKVYLVPVALTVDEFIKNKKEIFEKHKILSEHEIFSLIMSGATPNNSYESEAIDKLNPVSILYLYDRHPKNKKSEACRYGCTETLRLIETKYKKTKVFKTTTQQMGFVNATVDTYIRNDLTTNVNISIRTIKPCSPLFSEESIDKFIKGNPQLQKDIEEMAKNLGLI